MDLNAPQVQPRQDFILPAAFDVFDNIQPYQIVTFLRVLFHVPFTYRTLMRLRAHSRGLHREANRTTEDHRRLSVLMECSAD